MNRRDLKKFLANIMVGEVDLADWIGTATRTVQHWTAGDHPIPKAVAGLVRLLEEIRRDLGDYRVRRLLAASVSPANEAAGRRIVVVRWIGLAGNVERTDRLYPARNVESIVEAQYSAHRSHWSRRIKAAVVTTPQGKLIKKIGGQKK